MTFVAHLRTGATQLVRAHGFRYGPVFVSFFVTDEDGYDLDVALVPAGDVVSLGVVS